MEHDVLATDNGFRVRVTELQDLSALPNLPDETDPVAIGNREADFIGLIAAQVGDAGWVYVEKFALSGQPADEQITGLYNVVELNYCSDTGDVETREQARHQEGKTPTD